MFSKVSNFNAWAARVSLGAMLLLGLAPAQNAQFTALGPHSPDWEPPCLVASGGGAPVVASSDLYGGRFERWQQGGPWIQVHPNYVLAGISEDGGSFLGFSSDKKILGFFDRGNWSRNVFPNNLTGDTGYRLEEWAPAGIYQGQKFAAGVALFRKVGLDQYWQPFRLNLTDWYFEKLPRTAPSGLPFTGQSAVARTSGRLAMYASTSWLATPSLVITEVDGSTRELTGNFYPLSSAFRISANGRWMVVSIKADPAQMLPWPVVERWDLNENPPIRERLSLAPDGSFRIGAVANDGTVFGSVSSATEITSGDRRACLWHANGSRRFLEEALEEEFGLETAGWKFKYISDVSPDGKTLVGWGHGPATQKWLLELPHAIPAKAPSPPNLVLTAGTGGFGVGVTDNISATSASITLPSSKLNSDNRLRLRIQNSGDAPLNVQRLEITGENLEDFTYLGAAGPLIVPVAGAYEFEVKFSPQTRGFKSVILTVESDDPDAAIYPITLHGEGPAPVLKMEAVVQGTVRNDLNLRAVPGREVEQVIRLKNEGNEAATGLTAELIENTAAGLEVIVHPPATLEPYGTAEIRVRYLPLETGTGQATLRVQCEHLFAEPALFPITVAAEASANMRLLGQDGTWHQPGGPVPAYGEVHLGHAKDLQLNLKNFESYNISGLSTRIEGADASQFHLVNSSLLTNSSLWKGESKVLTLRFAPQTLGAKSARLVIDAPVYLEEPYVVELSGEGIPPVAPQLVTWPQSELNTGSLDNANLTVSGSQPLKYRIIKNGVAGTWYPLTSQWVGLGFNGEPTRNALYEIEVSNPGGVVKSPVFQRTRIDLEDNWATRRFDPGASCQLRCQFPASISSQLKFQWLKYGLPVAEDAVVTGVNGPVLSFANLSQHHAGKYSCRVTLEAPDRIVTALAGEIKIDVNGPPQIVPFSLRPARAMEFMSFWFDITNTDGLPLTVTVTGLPPGLQYRWGMVSGYIAPSAAAKGPKIYKVTVQAKNWRGKGDPFTAEWRIDPFDSSIAGTYHAIIERDVDSNYIVERLGGGITLTVTNQGKYTARIVMGGEARRLTGTIYGESPKELPDSYDPPLLSSMSAGVAHPVISQWDYKFAGNPTGFYMRLMGDLVGGELNNQLIVGFRQQPAPPELLAGTSPGRYHFALNAGETSVRYGDGSIPVGPEGDGFAVVQVNSKGAVTTTGKLPDGATITASSSLGRDAESGSWLIPLHQMPHGRWSSLLGFFGFQDGNEIGSALLDLEKHTVPFNSRLRLYPVIWLTPLTGEGSRYVTGKNLPLLGGAFDFTGKTPNGRLMLDEGGLSEDLELALRLEKTGRITAGPAAPLSAPRLSWTPSTGLFAAAATLTSPAPGKPEKTVGRSVTGAALWIPHLGRAAGWFTLPELANPAATPPTTATTSPINSGRATLVPVSASE